MNSRLRAVTASVLLVALFTPPVVFSSSGDKRQTVRTTAYTHSESDHLKYGRKTAVGTTLKRSTSYTSAAADWSRYPVGTTFRIKGSKTNYVIDDYGSALVGTGTIDIYHTSKSAMNHWGVRHVDIEILKWGDYEKSRQILSQRTKYKHCRQMYAAIPDVQKESKRGWFWNRKPRDTAPAPAPAATPTPEPQRAPEAPVSADVMLADNDKKPFGLRHWLSGRGDDNTTPTPAPQPENRSRPTAPLQPERQPEIERTQPEHNDVMLADNETTRSKNRWQWLRKLVGRDTAPEPATTPEIPAPGVPARPQFIDEQPDVNVMLASNTPAPAPASAAPRTQVPSPTPQSAPERIPAPPVPAPAPAPTPAPARVVLASAKVESTRPAPVAEPAPINEPIAIARTDNSTAVKVAHSDESRSEAPGQRVIFAIARPDSPVPHRKREVHALPANWKPGA